MSIYSPGWSKAPFFQASQRNLSPNICMNYEADFEPDVECTALPVRDASMFSSSCLSRVSHFSTHSHLEVRKELEFLFKLL